MKNMDTGCGTYESRPQKWPVLKIDITIDFFKEKSMYFDMQLDIVPWKTWTYRLWDL